MWKSFSSQYMHKINYYTEVSYVLFFTTSYFMQKRDDKMSNEHFHDDPGKRFKRFAVKYERMSNKNAPIEEVGVSTNSRRKKKIHLIFGMPCK